MLWSKYGFPDRLNITPWKTIITGLMKALQFKIFATGTMITPLRYVGGVNDIKIFDNKDSVYSLGYLDFRDTKFYADFDETLKYIWNNYMWRKPTYTVTQSGDYDDYPERAKSWNDILTQLNISTYIDIEPNLGDYYNAYRLSVNKYSRQWALDRYKIINAMNISNPLSDYQMGKEQPFNNLPNNSIETGIYPEIDNDSNSTNDLSCDIQNPRSGEYNIDYMWRDLALATGNQFIFKAKPTICLYYWKDAIRNVQGTFFEPYINYDTYNYKNINVTQYSQVNNTFYISNGQPFWKPDEIVANKQKFYQQGFGVFLTFNSALVDITGRDFYDDPAVYKDISYDDFWKYK